MFKHEWKLVEPNMEKVYELSKGKCMFFWGNGNYKMNSR